MGRDLRGRASFTRSTVTDTVARLSTTSRPSRYSRKHLQSHTLEGTTPSSCVSPRYETGRLVGNDTSRNGNCTGREGNVGKERNLVFRDRSVSTYSTQPSRVGKVSGTSDTDKKGGGNMRREMCKYRQFSFFLYKVHQHDLQSENRRKSLEKSFAAKRAQRFYVKCCTEFCCKDSSFYSEL